jgi:hypothetical protein
MKILLNRDSVCMGDDADSHEKLIEISIDGLSLAQILAEIAPGYLPSIADGQATWVVSSRVPIAVMAQQWNEKPKMLPCANKSEDKILDRRNGIIRLHFRYCTQQDPEQVWNKMSRDLRIFK